MSTIWDENGNIVEDDDYELSPEEQSLVVEAAMLDTLSNEEIESIMENYLPDFYRAVDEDIVQERSIVRLDKAAKISKATRTAEYNMAKKRKDPLFQKLLTIWKAERYLSDKIHQRYGMKAKTEAKKAVDQAMRSKSNVMNKVMSKAKKSGGRLEASERRISKGLNNSGVEGAMKSAMNVAHKVKK